MLFLCNSHTLLRTCVSIYCRVAGLSSEPLRHQMSNNTHGYGKKPKGGFKMGNKASPNSSPNKNLPEQIADAPTASSSSSAVQALYIPTTARDLGSASSSSSAAQTLYIRGDRRPERQDLFGEPRDFGSASSSWSTFLIGTETFSYPTPRAKEGTSRSVTLTVTGTDSCFPVQHRHRLRRAPDGHRRTVTTSNPFFPVQHRHRRRRGPTGQRPRPRHPLFWERLTLMDSDD